MYIILIYWVPNFCNKNIDDGAKHLNWIFIVRYKVVKMLWMWYEDVMDMIWRCDGCDMKMYLIWRRIKLYTTDKGGKLKIISLMA